MTHHELTDDQITYDDLRQRDPYKMELVNALYQRQKSPILTPIELIEQQGYLGSGRQ